MGKDGYGGEKCTLDSTATLETALWNAALSIRRDDEDKFDELEAAFDAGANINVAFTDYDPPFEDAISSFNPSTDPNADRTLDLALVRFFLERNADPNGYTSYP